MYTVISWNKEVQIVNTKHENPLISFTKCKFLQNMSFMSTQNMHFKKKILSFMKEHVFDYFLYIELI